MQESLYRVVNKHMLGIFTELSIPIPMSHPIEGKLAALEWMTLRGMQAECEVISEDCFRVMNGGLPKVDKSA
jgi:hypothetical protein